MRGFGAEAISELRQTRPELRLVHVEADDMDDHEAFAERPGYRVFLLASDGHCLTLTAGLDSAVGLILAEL